jgi:hypothetical protein
MQKAHMLLQPRMMDTKADVLLASWRTGMMSAYVSSSESCTFIAALPCASPAYSDSTQQNMQFQVVD